jgi:hypothetical protein
MDVDDGAGLVVSGTTTELDGAVTDEVGASVEDATPAEQAASGSVIMSAMSNLMLLGIRQC